MSGCYFLNSFLEYLNDIRVVYNKYCIYTVINLKIPSVYYHKSKDIMKNNYSKVGLQRLFQKDINNFLLLHKNGKAVAFQLDQNENINIVGRQTDISFKSTFFILE